MSHIWWWSNNRGKVQIFCKGHNRINAFSICLLVEISVHDGVDVCCLVLRCIIRMCVCVCVCVCGNLSELKLFVVCPDEVLQVLAWWHWALRRHQDNAAEDGNAGRVHRAHLCHGEGESCSHNFLFLFFFQSQLSHIASVSRIPTGTCLFSLQICLIRFYLLGALIEYKQLI